MHGKVVLYKQHTISFNNWHQLGMSREWLLFLAIFQYFPHLTIGTHRQTGLDRSASLRSASIDGKGDINKTDKTTE